MNVLAIAFNGFQPERFFLIIIQRRYNLRQNNLCENSPAKLEILQELNTTMQKIVLVPLLDFRGMLMN